MEQLRVHVRNLSMLGINGATDSKGRVELYERGYGKDAAGIAKEAITYGKRSCSLLFYPSDRLVRPTHQRETMILMWYSLTPLGECRTMRYAACALAQFCPDALP